jgi:tartrate-resistant acid phosphatase type 5
MAEWCDYNRCDFIFSMGDNFYNEGVTSPTDPRFDSSWKNVYNQPSLANLVWYQSIGNHDHDQVGPPGDGREVNQVKTHDLECIIVSY